VGEEGHAEVLDPEQIIAARGGFGRWLETGHGIPAETGDEFKT
jgi:hypothetical protein